MSDGKYVRVYYSVINDERFAAIYNDARHFGTWLQLLLIADAMYPADCPIPAYINRASFKALTECGLVEIRAHLHFKMHGLASEREMRAQSARSAAAVRWQSERNAERMPRQDKTRQDKGIVVREHSARAPAEGNADQATPVRTPRQEVGDWLLARGAGRPSGWVATTLSELVKVYGSQRILEVWQKAPSDAQTSKQFVQYVEHVLSPRVNGQSAEDSMKGVKATQAYLRNLRGTT